MTEDFRKLFPVPNPMENEDRRFDLQDIRTYLTKCSNPAHKKSSACGVFKAAMLARLKSTMFQADCVAERVKAAKRAGGSNTKPASAVDAVKADK